MVRPDGIKFVTQGSLPGGEEWTTSFALGGQDGPYAGLDLADLCNDVMAAWADWQTSFPWIAEGVTVNQVRGYVYGGGDLVEQRISTAEPITGTGTPRFPNQCALVISLLSDRPGRRYRGRMYLPALTPTMTATGRIGSNVSQGMANAASAFLEQVGTAVPLGLRAALHPVIASSVGTGDTTDVVSVRCGDVIDTQRRRREGLSETYAEAAVNVPG